MSEQFNDAYWQNLIAQLGVSTGQYNDLEAQLRKAQLASPDGDQTDDMLKESLIDLGLNRGHIHDMLKEHVISKGYLKKHLFSALRDMNIGREPFYGGGLIMNATFTTNENLDSGGGVLTGTLANGATVSGGFLDQDLAYAQQSYCQWAALNNFTCTQQGTVNILVRPNYSGSPASHIQDFFFAGTAAGNKYVLIQHDTAGNLRFQIYDAASGLNFQITSPWSPTLGQTYELELNWDIDLGETRAFIDGTQFGATNTTTGTFNALGGTDFIRCGRGYWTFSHNSNFSIDQFDVYDAVQHTAAY